jgi:hypothetical protein
MDKVDIAIVCFSGGHSSALVAIEAVKRYGKSRVILLNHNISSHVEHQDIKRFKENVSNYCDVPITYANAQEYESLTPIKVCEMMSGFGINAGNTFCTYELKTKPFYNYLESIPKEVGTYSLGFDEWTSTVIQEEPSWKQYG